MAKPIKLIFLLVGFLLLGWAVSTVDLTVVANLLIKLGYGFIIILIIYGMVTWFDTIAWQKNFTPEETRQFSLWNLWCIRQIGEAYNTITPLGTLGGEPVKAQLLKERHGLPLKQGMVSQVIARTTFLMALVLFFIPGTFFILRSNMISEEMQLACLIGMAVFSVLILLFLMFQITGTLGILARWILSLPLGREIAVFLDKLKLVDQGISLHYKHHTSRVIKSVLYAFLGWTIGLAELYVTLYFFGYKPNLIDLWVIEALAQLVRVGSFFIPLGIGTQEGGLLLIFTALGMPGDIGITVSFVRRIKELLWVGIGLTIGWSLSCHPAQSRSKEN